MTVADFVANARRPRRSVLIYSRPDVIADLDRINQELAVAKAANDDDKAAELEQQWHETALIFHGSALRVTVEGRTQAEISALRAGAKAEGLDDEEEAAVILADAIVTPQMTKDDLIGLRRSSGDVTVEILLQAWKAACFDPPPLAPEPDNG